MMKDWIRPGITTLFPLFLFLSLLRGGADPSLEEAWERLKAATPHFSQGLKEFQEGRNAEASAAFQICVRKMPGHAYAHYYLANLDYIREDYQSALLHVEQALGNFAFMRELGEYADARKVRNIDSFRQKLDQEWENTNSCRTLRKLESLDDQLSGTKNSIEALANRRRDASARQLAHYLYFSGNVLFQLKRFPEALQRYREAIAQDPNHASAYNNAAALCYQAGEYPAAFEFLERAERQGLEDVLNLRLKHLIFEALGRPTEGILREDIAPDGGNGPHVVRFALAHKKEGSALPPLYENGYVVFDGGSKQAVLVDPGVQDPRIGDLVRSEGLEIRAILNTHDHPDHTDADGYYSGLFGAPVCIHKKDAKYLSRRPERYLEDGEILDAGGLRVRVILTPGHTRGSLCFLIGDLLFTGDTLFKNGIGKAGTEDPDRTAKDRDALVRNIREKLLGLPGGTRVCPGHGRTSTIADEKALNPFLRSE